MSEECKCLRWASEAITSLYFDPVNDSVHIIYVIDLRLMLQLHIVTETLGNGP